MYKYVISKSPDGFEIYINLITSSAGHYLSRQPHVINLIKEVLLPMDLSASQIFVERDMGRIIGNTDIVDTTDKDTIFYAQPNKKQIYSRYAKNRYPAPCKMLTIILQKDENGDYEVTDTWIGPHSPPFPGDEHATVKSKPYWENHALVYNTDAIQSKTITKDCPY